MNAVIYARYSSVGQRDVSIDDQVREITQFAQYNNYKILHTYADRAMTGRNDKRPQFRKMIEDAANGLFQVVLVYKHDRFSRNQYDAIVYKKMLADHGVKVIAVTEPIPDGHGAKILESIYQAMAEEYSINLSQNVKRGQKGNALKCLANHQPPFGYQTNPQTRKFEINPTEAPLVKTIYEMTLAGHQQHEILEYLKQHGFKRSKHWLYHVLRNERYIGVYIHGEVRTEGGMPQIIDKETFNQVRNIMLQRQHKPQLKPYTYLLSGKIFCGYCNKMMCGESAKSHTGTLYRYYTCLTSKKHQNCTKQRIKAEAIESKVTETLRNILFTDTMIDRLANDVYNYINSNHFTTLSLLQEQLTDTQHRIDAIQQNVELGLVPRSMMERYMELEQIKDGLLAKISDEQANEYQKSSLKELIRKYRCADDRTLVHNFVTKLTLYDTYAILEYDVSGENITRIDFVSGNVWRNTMLPHTKLYIKNATLYIRFSLAA